MKRALLAGVLLAAMIAGGMVHVGRVNGLTGRLEATLSQAEALAWSGDWEEALRLTGEAETDWRGLERYLRVTVRHDGMDQVTLAFGEVRANLLAREEGSYAAANARLKTGLRLLGEAERLTVENLL